MWQATIRAEKAARGDHEVPPSTESLASMREDVRRERLLDMEDRMKRYRVATFAILVLAGLAVGPEVGWWWIAPLVGGLAGFAVADHFLVRSQRPQVWIAAAWSFVPLLVAGSIAATGGPDSPFVMWFAIPAVTLGSRFESRGIAVGAAYILALLLLSTVAVDPAAAAENYTTLVVSVGLILSTVILSSALAESDRTHRRRSTIDPLTGAFNRNALDQRLAELDGHPTSAAEGICLSFLLCDLDHFKRVNDDHGHVVGDAVLQDAVYVIRDTLRASDAIYRVGGEEFLIVLPGAGEDSAEEIATRLCAAVRERVPGGVKVTVSIGVAASSSGHLDTDEMVSRADSALYAAKGSGRDQVFVSTSPKLAA